MIQPSNFPNACKEVYCILKYLEPEDIACIPNEFIELIKTNMNKDYVFEYNDDISFENQNLLQETKAIFAYVFLNFWSNAKQVESIKMFLNNDYVKKKSKETNMSVNEKLRKEDIEKDAEKDVKKGSEKEIIEEVQITKYKKKFNFIDKIKKIMIYIKKIFK